MKLVTFGEGPTAFTLPAKSIYLIINHEHNKLTCAAKCPLLTNVAYRFPEFHTSVSTSLPTEECIDSWYEALNS